MCWSPWPNDWLWQKHDMGTPFHHSFIFVGEQYFWLCMLVSDRCTNVHPSTLTSWRYVSYTWKTKEFLFRYTGYILLSYLQDRVDKSGFWLWSSRMLSHHSKFSAHTGNPHPNISTTFIGRSRPDEDLWRHTPRSAEPAKYKPVYWTSSTLIL